MYFLGFISIIGWTLFLSVKFKKYAAAFPFLIVTTIITILYVGSLMSILLPVSRNFLILGYVLPIYLVWRKQLTWEELKNVPLSFLFLVIFGIVWFVFTWHAGIFGSDEFAWGQFAKVIYSTNGLYTAGSAIMDGKLNYPPGISLFQYFFLNLGSYSEAAIYFAQGVFVFAAVAPILDLIGRNWKRLLTFGMAIGTTLVYFGPGLLSMTNDHIIGVAFANAILTSSFILLAPKSKLLLVPIIVALPLIKTTGMIISLAIILVVSMELLISNFKRVREKKFKAPALKLILVPIVLLFCAFVSMKSWDLYLQGQGAGATPMPGPAKIFKSFSSQASDKEKLTVKNFNIALLERPINNQEGDIKSGQPIIKFYLKTIDVINRPGLSIIGWLQLFAVIFGLIVYFQNPRNRFLNFTRYLSLLVGLGIYLFFHLLAYMYYFSVYEGTNLFSLNRYVSSYFMGLALIAIGSMAVLFKDNHRQIKMFGMMSGAIFVYLLIFHTPSLVRLVVPPRMIAESTNVVRRQTIPFSSYINANTNNDSKIWLIYQNTRGWECMMVRYDIVPRKMNGGGGNWSLGDKYGHGDVWTNNLPKDVWSSQLLDEHYNYVFLAKADDNFWNHYADLFQNPTEAKLHQLFQVQQLDNRALLVAK